MLDAGGYNNVCRFAGGIFEWEKAGHPLEGYIVGSLLLCSAFLVSYLDICIPSMIYNAIFKKKQVS
jgi:hypothetical protein